LRSLCVFLIASVLSIPSVAFATGTARVQQSDGSVKTYKNVRISVAEQHLSITSSDGKGTLVINRAACYVVGKLMRCLPSSAVLNQNGSTLPIAIEYGSAWFNPSSENQQLPHSSTQLPPHGVLLSLQTKRGTYVTLDGIVDEKK